jgi:ADP-heptose:LPS heptosyltransferase
MRISTIKFLDYYVGSSILVLLKPIVILLGNILRRDHDLKINKNVTFVKLLGGGSLVIAFPALLGLRKKYPDLKINLVTTKEISPFARSLNIFDDYFEIDRSGVLKILLTSVVTFIRTFGTDTIIDLEVHSKLTTVFSVLTAARNRIGFYVHDAFWRRRVYTHMVFFNNYSGTYEFYDKIVQLFSASPSSAIEGKEHVLKVISGSEKPEGIKGDSGKYKLCIGHACSDLSRERMLSISNWERVFLSRLDTSFNGEVIFLGGYRDRELASGIIERVNPYFKNTGFINLCGKTNLNESLSVLSLSNEFWGIDSSLIHYARLLRIKCVSFWGPTDPKGYLRRIPDLLEEVVYCKIPCSPCIHITESPPCMGDNVCIQNLFSKEKREWPGIVT